MQLTPSQLELVRTHPQQTRLYLSIFQPRIVFQCKVNNPSAAKGDRIIPYNNVSFGAYTNVEAGMTLLIGTSLGGSEVGRLRIRSVDASQFIVSENSNINWQDQLFLTVLRYWEVWPIFPRIIQDPNNEENVIFYKDYDIAYTNQNTVLGTFVCAGPHRGAFLDGGQALIWYSSTGTYNVNGSSLSYYWEFEGGTPATSTSPDPGYVAYSTPGHYVTKLSISGSAGESDVTYRYVSIYDRPSAGNKPPIEKWELSTMDGSRSEGGINSVTLRVYDQIQISDNAVVVLFAEDWYGNTKQSLGGNYPNAPDIFFVGYVEKDTIQYNYQKSFIQFNATSITGLMKNAVGFSVSTQDDAAPDTWYKIYALDVRRAIYHYLRWHTTVQNVADFQFVGQDYPIQYFDADRTSMFDALDNLMRGTLIGSLVADRQGKLWAEVDAQAYSNPTGTFAPVMSISKRDWMGEPQVEERVQDETSYIEYGGIAYTGIASGTFQALLAGAPGNAPSFRGKADSPVEGLALSSQAQLNQLVGNILANKNTRVASVRLNITENLRNLDIAPQETVSVHIDAQDTNKNIPIDILGIPDNFSWKYDHENGLLIPTISFKNLVSGIPGDSISIPVPSEVGGGYNVSSFQVPAFPTYTFSLPSGTTTGTAAGMPYIDLGSASSTLVATNYSAGAWGPAQADTSGLWVTVLYDGLYYVAGSAACAGGSLPVDTIPFFIAVRTGGGWGTVYREVFRDSLASYTDFPHTIADPYTHWVVSSYYPMVTAVVHLTAGQTIGIGMDTSNGGSSTTRRLQVALLALG